MTKLYNGFAKTGYVLPVFGKNRTQRNPASLNEQCSFYNSGTPLTAAAKKVTTYDCNYGCLSRAAGIMGKVRMHRQFLSSEILLA